MFAPSSQPDGLQDVLEQYLHLEEADATVELPTVDDTVVDRDVRMSIDPIDMTLAEAAASAGWQTDENEDFSGCFSPVEPDAFKFYIPRHRLGRLTHTVSRPAQMGQSPSPVARSTSFNSVISAGTEVDALLREGEFWNEELHLLRTHELGTQAQILSGTSKTAAFLICPVTGCDNSILCSEHALWEKHISHSEDSCREIPRNPPLPLEELIAHFEENRNETITHSSVNLNLFVNNYVPRSNYIATVSVETEKSPQFSKEEELIHVVCNKLSRYCGYFFADSREQEYFDKIRMQEIFYRLNKTYFDSVDY
ncbi:LAMI_0D04566g1_1 [Lachancea mirantina]|uniref:LAMI_0D04566g1_1 n=1 Tax=Lachancea mirantina TaxID=1230905 RepID=A0A1G4JAH4_9SACH|nr:LAMI_0D04566g1_1 [Lachancea mirantina]